MKLYQLLLVCFFTIAAAEDARYEELGKYQIYGPGLPYSCSDRKEEMTQFTKDANTLATKAIA